MSLIKAVFFAGVWAVVCTALMADGAEISPDMQILTTAIIVAGALAGRNK